MGKKEKDSSFIFELGSEVPKIEINGNKLGVVEVEYYWTTATERRGCISNANVSGYLNGENKLRIFQIDFTSNEVSEVSNGGN